jgi:hypothetical protein
MITSSITTRILATWVPWTRTRKRLEQVALFLCVVYAAPVSLNSMAFRFSVGLVGAPACGDVMKLQFETDENGIIIDAKFKTFGCGSAIGESTVIP